MSIKSLQGCHFSLTRFFPWHFPDSCQIKFPDISRFSRQVVTLTTITITTTTTTTTTTITIKYTDVKVNWQPERKTNEMWSINAHNNFWRKFDAAWQRIRRTIHLWFFSLGNLSIVIVMTTYIRSGANCWVFPSSFPQRRRRMNTFVAGNDHFRWSWFRRGCQPSRLNWCTVAHSVLKSCSSCVRYWPLFWQNRKNAETKLQANTNWQGQKTYNIQIQCSF